jgi:predicted RNase H-like HicB family nuclease
MEQHSEASRLEAGGYAMKYAVVIEHSPHNYAAYVPDLPGCVATGSTREEVERNIREAIIFHLDGLRDDGLPIPEPQTTTISVEVGAGT